MKPEEVEKKVNELLKITTSLENSGFSVQSFNIYVGTSHGLTSPIFRMNLMLTEKPNKLERIIGKKD